MTKIPLPTGKIVFQCICSRSVDGIDEDTLMSEGRLEGDDNTQKHAVFIENAPFDPAGNIVKKECDNCKLPFMTAVQIGQNLAWIYVCSCGYKISHQDQMKITH